jgi:uncharacterized protein YkwD
MPRARTFLASVAAAAILGIVPASASAACPNELTYAAELSEYQLEESITCLINERRTERGLGRVRDNARLRHAAVDHSQAMVAGGFFSHTAPNGSSFVDRIESSGYMRGARLWLVGENLVWGTGDLSTPSALVKAWMDSPAHRGNLLRNRFKEIGVGVQRGTPFNANETDGITVSSEYGFRVRNRSRAHSSRKKR